MVLKNISPGYGVWASLHDAIFFFFFFLIFYNFILACILGEYILCPFMNTNNDSGILIKTLLSIYEHQ